MNYRIYLRSKISFILHGALYVIIGIKLMYSESETAPYIGLCLILWAAWILVSAKTVYRNNILDFDGHGLR